METEPAGLFQKLDQPLGRSRDRQQAGSWCRQQATGPLASQVRRRLEDVFFTTRHMIILA